VDRDAGHGENLALQGTGNLHRHYSRLRRVLARHRLDSPNVTLTVLIAAPRYRRLAGDAVAPRSCLRP
jgi:hypothetical protein